MHGFKEDLLNCVVDMIAQNWEKRGGDLSYFVNKVKTSGLTVAELDEYLAEQGDVCPECVNHVFAAIVYKAAIDGSYSVQEKKGGDK